jgi:hypothetical protein
LIDTGASGGKTDKASEEESGGEPDDVEREVSLIEP